MPGSYNIKLLQVSLCKIKYYIPGTRECVWQSFSNINVTAKPIMLAVEELNLQKWAFHFF